MAPYGTDGVHIRRAGIPTYGTIGLFIRESEVFAHGLNERVPVRSFYDGLEYWHAVMVTLGESGRPPQPPAGSWLDRPLTTWNKPGAAIPAPRAPEEDKTALITRCGLKRPAATAPEKALDAAGWITFWNFDQQLVRDGIEIVAGMSGADGMCRPADYNLFVFVDGRYAGTLSPETMVSRTDGSSGAVRMPLPQLTAEFSRFAPTDPLCCPSSRVTVRYRIDRPSEGPVVIPVDVRTTRGQ
jgi:hypothetical protein